MAVPFYNHRSTHFLSLSLLPSLSLLTSDAETAASAYRNLQDTDVRGRPLRIDYAELDETFQGRTTQNGQIDPSSAGGGGGGGGPSGGRGRGGRGGGPIGNGPNRTGGMDQGWGNRSQNPLPPPSMQQPPGQGFQSTAPPPAGQLPNDLPKGKPLPNGVSSGDAITQTLAALPPGQLLDIMSQMKVSLMESAQVLLLFDSFRRRTTARKGRVYAFFSLFLPSSSTISLYSPLSRVEISDSSSSGFSFFISSFFSKFKRTSHEPKET